MNSTAIAEGRTTLLVSAENFRWDLESEIAPL